MPDVPLWNMKGEQMGAVTLSDTIFGAPRNHGLIHQAIVMIAQSQKRYAGHTKDRADINRTTAKWYRQKGTGRARHGSRSASIFVGGLKAHGPNGVPRSVSMPRKMRRKALYSALSAQLADGVIPVAGQGGA